MQSNACLAPHFHCVTLRCPLGRCPAGCQLMWLLFCQVMFNTYPVHPLCWDRRLLHILHALQLAKPRLPELSTRFASRRSLQGRYELEWAPCHRCCHAVQGSGKAREVRTTLNKRVKDAMTDAFSWFQDAAMVTKWGPSVYWAEVDGCKELQMNQEVALALAEGKFLTVMQTCPGSDCQIACQLPSLSLQRNLHCSTLTKHTPTAGLMHTGSGTV